MWGSLALGAGSMGLGALGSMFGSSGARKQLQLMREALDYQKGIDTRTYNDLSPYRQFGADQLTGLKNFMADRDANDFIDPGYDFRLKSGSNAIANNAATSGMLQSGDTLRALTEYGQNMGSQEYNNAFGRFLGEGQFRQGLTGIGQNAVVQGGQLANQGAANVANISANTDAGASDRIWGDYFSGMGGMGMQQFAKGGGVSGITNSFSNIFQKAPSAPYQSPNWLGVYGR